MDRRAPLPFALPLLALLLGAGCAHEPARPGSGPPQRRRARVARGAAVERIRALVEAAAHRHGVTPALVLGVIQVESGFRPDVRSHAGARGLMQLMPGTAASLARRLRWEDYDIDDPAFNIEAGTAYLGYLIKRFNDERLALAAYNAGPARVKRWVAADRPLPGFSRRYVDAVLAARERFARGGEAEQDDLDRSGLRALLRRRLYGDRADEAI